MGAGRSAAIAAPLGPGFRQSSVKLLFPGLEHSKPLTVGFKFSFQCGYRALVPKHIFVWSLAVRLVSNL